MKLYYNKSHYDKTYRRHLFPLLKPFIKQESFTDTERIEMYAISERDVTFVKNIEASDIVILTMSWNYYEMTNQMTLAFNIVKQAKALNKTVLSVNIGDFGVVLPKLSRVLIYRESGYRSKLSKLHQGMPVFITDPLQKYYNSKTIFTRPFQPIPSVGFCGQVNGDLLNALKEILKVSLRNIKYYFRLTNYCPQDVQSTSYLRYQLLHRLEKSPSISTNFIFRKKHGAGMDFNRTSHPVTLEFYNNIKESDYILCYRGAGNFSVRFYETLAMGRIPVLVNTDCMLPLANEIDWKKHVVWVDAKEQHLVAEKIRDFHSALTADTFLELQQNNRLLWESHLTLGGFFKYALKAIRYKDIDS